MRISISCIGLLVILIVQLTCLQVANAGELEERSRIQNEVVLAYKDRDFQLLEKIANKYRESSERTSAGAWKLALFYKAFLEVANPKIKSRVYWDEQLEVTTNWENAFPDSPSPKIVHGLFLHASALSYRGEGWANTVPKANMEAYLEGANIALKYLLKTKETGSKDAHWYNTITNILKGIGTDKKANWTIIAEGLDRYPYYDENYFAAAEFYSPIWGGSDDELETFARSAVNRTKDKINNSMYTRIYWATLRYKNFNPIVAPPPVDWELMKAGMDDVLRDYPDQWNINNFAYFSCVKGDMVKAKELIAKIQEPPIARAWGGSSNYFTCKDATQK